MDAHLVRRITERLIASGLEVWCAEYQVLLSNRWLFQRMIDRGIKLSRYGLAFTSDDYVTSKYCCREMRHLLSLVGPKKIVDIRLREGHKTRELFPLLQMSPAIEYKEDDNEILDLIGKLTGRSILAFDRGSQEQEQSHTGLCFGANYKLDIAGWKSAGSGNSFGQEVESFEYKIVGEPVPVQMNFYQTKENAKAATRSERSQDDRKLYNKLVLCARTYFKKGFPSTPLGVHLHFFHGFSQLALTYWVKSKYPYWSRKYSVVLLHPLEGYPVEFVFTFGVANKSFKEFCRLIPIMDRVVASLRWVGK